MYFSYFLVAIVLSSVYIVETTTLNKDQGSENENQSLKILVMIMPVRGHLNPLLTLSKKLTSRGHNITFAMGTNENCLLKQEELEELISRHGANASLFVSNVLSNIQKKTAFNFDKMRSVQGNLIAYAEELMQNFADLLSMERFDVIIGNEFVVPPLVCINSHWKIPAVIVGSTMPILISEEPSWPWPGVVQGHSSDDLSFPQRLISLVETVIIKQVFNYFMWRPQLSALHKFCPSMRKEQLYDAPGVYLPHIVPTVIGFEYPRTLMPLTSYVGPLIPEEPSRLSQVPNLKDWLDSKSEKSVVYLSMGSVFPLDKETANFLVEGVMKTNYSLLWSLRKSNQWILDGFDIDQERVHISEWTPQFSVLASKTIHSAILHGGFNGLSEALWNGVPIVGFPQMFEQSLSVGRLYHNKLGLRLDKATLNSAKVTEAIVSIDNGNYRSNLRKLKKIFQLAGGLNRTVELIEFYGREGYAHLIPAYAKYHWSWIQFYNVDVWLLLASVVGLLFFFMLKSLKCLMKCCFIRIIKQKTA